MPEALAFRQWVGDVERRKLTTSYIRNAKRTEARLRWLDRMKAGRLTRLGPFATDLQWTSGVPF
ncbi:hypothetical protein OO015_02095 [Thermomicrobium sp. 4228-Ro]|uniref:hypothetical protein n=1 Tax=Thermomicrobium sp. 4228-Ro TaxID=2993937 RepID=UPI0022499C51|nr:hypothetical protein [Thermomicrobium sp. 4228-Ro]MCX2726285.1 hypothetical protein [Thermomicrobium sp. 4228-Ro]